jgi:hypothetical protein
MESTCLVLCLPFACAKFLEWLNYDPVASRFIVYSCLWFLGYIFVYATLSTCAVSGLVSPTGSHAWLLKINLRRRIAQTSMSFAHMLIACLGSALDSVHYSWIHGFFAPNTPDQLWYVRRRIVLHDAVRQTSSYSLAICSERLHFFDSTEVYCEYAVFVKA